MQKQWIVITKNALNLLPNAVNMDSLTALQDRKVLAIVLDLDSTSSVWQTLTDIRRQPDLQLIPLFYHGQLKQPEYECLFDGSFENSSLEKANRINDCIAQLAEPYNKEIMLLNYLFVRHQYTLSPYLDCHSSQGFRYLLIELLFSDDFKSPWSILQDLVSWNFLKPQHLIDELNNCPSCGSALFNFKRCCPSCQSTNTIKQQLAHCFSCQHISADAHFFQENSLKCPQCSRFLRHQGIDYDKPIEDKQCLDCNHYFSEPIVKGRCLQCDQLTDVLNLESSKVYSYQLTNQGSYLVRGLQQRINNEITNCFNLISFKSFMLILNWQTNLLKRHNEVYFAVCLMKIMNVNALISKLGLVKAEKTMINFLNKVRVLFRDSDLVSRNQDNTLLLLPMTPEKSCMTIFKKIIDFAKGSDYREQLEISFGYLHSAELINDYPIEEEALIRRLESKIERLALD